MPLPKLPLVRVFEAALATIAEADIHIALEELLLAMGDGVVPATLTLRTARNRFTTLEEQPCLALAFVSDEPMDRTDPQVDGEMFRALALDIIMDAEIPTEVEATEGDESDTARIEILSYFLLFAVKALKASWIDEAGAPTPLTTVARWVEDLGIDDDEDLADEKGRLVCRVNVIYRVRSDDPTVLLTTE